MDAIDYLAEKYKNKKNFMHKHENRIETVDFPRNYDKIETEDRIKLKNYVDYLLKER